MSDRSPSDSATSSFPAAEEVSAFVGAPLSVVFATGEAIERLREDGEGLLELVPPFHFSDEDLYLVLPDDIGMEIIDILDDGDLELLHESMRDGLLAIGTLERSERIRGGHRTIALAVELAISPAEALAKGLPYAKTLTLRPDPDLTQKLNQLDHLQCTMLSAFIDDEGIEQVLRQPEFAGVSWRPPESMSHLKDIEPTYIWSRRQEDATVGVELALFREYEELVALLRPLSLETIRAVG